MNYSFLVNRLARMSPQEVLYRVGQKVQNYMEQSRSESICTYGKITDSHECLLSGKVSIAAAENILAWADRLCSNRMDVFALKDIAIDSGINYHKDYKSGLTAPPDIFGKSIDYRDYSKIGDIKYIWEPNRHLFLLPLALAYAHTEKKKYLEKIESFLLEWFVQNPFMKGVNWSSSLELGIRLINWTTCWHLIAGHISPDIRKTWLESIYEHCWFIDKNFSKFSSANNHLIGEAAGLFVASTAFPGMDKAKQWRDKSYQILVEECEKQNYSDGVNKEQAISYQQFVLDFLILSGLYGKAKGVEFPDSYWKCIERMLEFVAAIEDVAGNIPQTGDEDDGYVIDAGQREFGVFHSLLNTGAFLFNRKDFLRGSYRLDTKTALLMSIGGYCTDKLPEGGKQIPSSFKAGGYYILGTDFGSRTEQKLLFDCGPLGYLSLAAHGHADALSFCFSAGGSPIFIDPGTYAYHTQKLWRNYFRSTPAHNTLCVDRLDQSVIAGNFMWSKKAKAKLLSLEEGLHVKGCHDGYGRLKDPAIHSREVSYDRDSDLWIITDEVSCKGKHEISLYFHLHPDCMVEEAEGYLKIYFKAGCCTLDFEKGLKAECFEASMDPILGWYSGSYDIKTGTKTLRFSKQIQSTTKIETKFKVTFI